MASFSKIRSRVANELVTGRAEDMLFEMANRFEKLQEKLAKIEVASEGGHPDPDRIVAILQEKLAKIEAAVAGDYCQEKIIAILED